MKNQQVTQSRKSYNQILKSTTIIGGSSIVNIFLRIVRVKLLAVWLGPAGMGLIGIYDEIIKLVGTFAGLGIQTSGVRQIAEAATVNSQIKIAETIITLRRVALFTGIFGMILIILLSKPISLLTFGHVKYSSDILILSVIPLFAAITNGQTALIQGMRRISDLAKISILSSFFGTVLSISIIYIWGKQGIVPYLIALAATGILSSWWYAKKIIVVPIRMELVNIWKEADKLLKLGIGFMVTALINTGAIYLVNVLVVRELGLDAAGLYQAAATLSIFYVGFILDAMGKDYYPRLSAIAKDNAACNQLINEQAEIGLLLSVPGILVTLTFTPVIIHLFYSSKFIPAYEILRWQVIGILLRVVNWPMAFTIIAKGKMKIYFWTELSKNTVLLGSTWICIHYFGLFGSGIAFLGTELFYWFLIFCVLKRLTGFTWSAANTRLCLLVMPSIVIVFLVQFILDGVWFMIFGGSVALAFGYYTIKCLIEIIGPNSATSIISRIKEMFSLSFR